MAAKRTPIRVFLLLSIIALVGALFPIPSDAVTKSQVDEACASSKAQLADYRAAQKAFEDAAVAYEAALNDVAQLEQKQGRIQASVDSQSETLAQVQDQLTDQVKAFVNDPARTKLQGNTLYVTKIMDWFSEDFHDDPVGFVKMYAQGDLKKRLEARGKGVEVEYLDYDWSLNGT